MMKQKLLTFIKRNALAFAMVGGLGAYILVAGTTGSCPACVAITQAAGIPSFVSQREASANQSPAPEWTLKDVDEREVSSSDFQGKIILVDFWATWCPPCKKMIPGLIELQKEYSEQGFEVVAISLDEGGAPAIKAFNKKYGVNYTSLLANADVLKAFGGIQNIPTSFLIDQNGQIVSKHVGFVGQERLASEIRKLLVPESA